MKLSCSYFYKLKGFKGTSSETGVSKKKKSDDVLLNLSAAYHELFTEKLAIALSINGIIKRKKVERYLVGLI